MLLISAAVSHKCTERALLSKCHESTPARALQEKQIASPPALTEGLYVIYWGPGAHLVRKCDLLPAFSITACRPFLEPARRLSCASTGKTCLGKAEPHCGLHYRCISCSWWASGGSFLAGWFSSQPCNCYHWVMPCVSNITTLQMNLSWVMGGNSHLLLLQHT